MPSTSPAGLYRKRRAAKPFAFRIGAVMSTRLFTQEALSSLLTPGIAERWAAVQERLHPLLAELAARVGDEAGGRFPRQWPLYEVSYKAQRYVNRGKGGR